MLKVSTILIKPSHENFKECENLCYACKNIYNRANFLLRQEYFTNKNWIRSNELNKLFRSDKADYILYSSIPNNSSMQVIQKLDSNWKSFFQSVKEYNVNPKKFKKEPNPPNYLNKENGKFLCAFSANQFTIHGNILHFALKTKLKPIKIDPQLLNTKIQQIRIIPKLNSYNIEIVYHDNAVVNPILSSNIGSIDLGLNNLAAFTSNISGDIPTIFNGRILKSINNNFHKLKSKMQSKLPKGIKTSKKIRNLCEKRNRKIDSILHKTSKLIVEKCVNSQISKLVIGYNEGWKHAIKLGKKNNQKFVSVPFYKFLQMLEYKCKQSGISFYKINEAYTSKCSSFDLEEIRIHEKYKGKRIKRGLFETADKTLINSDVNGSYNILRKFITEEKINVSDLFLKQLITKGCIAHPLKV